ncbi:MAG TPA: DUF1003 domain-containing protein [Vicinamibacterales bacterium]|nr:DUF1003 domain-containing protein [Vicinamibacterales bacterium]
MLRQHSADVESLAYVLDMDDQDNEPCLLDFYSQKFDQIGVRIDDGDDRLSRHEARKCIAHTGRPSFDGIDYLQPDELAGVLTTTAMVMDEHATVLRKNIRAIADLEQRALHQRSAADRMSDAITRATGSGPFVLFHIIGFSVWILLNVRILSIEPFDPFPFSFLTLIVSLEAIFLSVFVLMSQNRMTRQAEKRAHLDLQVDMLAEQELTAILRMVQGLCEKQGVEVLARDDRLEELVKETDVHTVAAALEDRLPDS